MGPGGRDAFVFLAIQYYFLVYLFIKLNKQRTGYFCAAECLNGVVDAYCEILGE